MRCYSHQVTIALGQGSEKYAQALQSAFQQKRNLASTAEQDIIFIPSLQFFSAPYFFLLQKLDAHSRLYVISHNLAGSDTLAAWDQSFFLHYNQLANILATNLSPLAKGNPSSQQRLKISLLGCRAGAGAAGNVSQESFAYNLCGALANQGVYADIVARTLTVLLDTFAGRTKVTIDSENVPQHTELYQRASELSFNSPQRQLVIEQMRQLGIQKRPDSKKIFRWERGQIIIRDAYETIADSRSPALKSKILGVLEACETRTEIPAKRQTLAALRTQIGGIDSRNLRTVLTLLKQAINPACGLPLSKSIHEHSFRLWSYLGLPTHTVTEIRKLIQELEQYLHALQLQSSFYEE